MVMDVKRWHDKLTPAQRAAYERGREIDRMQSEAARSENGQLN